MPALNTADADLDRIVPVPPTRKKRTSANPPSHIEVLDEPVTLRRPVDPEPQPESQPPQEPVPTPDVTPESIPAASTQGAVPKKKKSFFKKLKEIDINININVSDGDKKEEKADDAPPKRPTSLHLNSAKLIETAEETFSMLRRRSKNHTDPVVPDPVVPVETTANGETTTSNTTEEPKPEEPKPKLQKKKSLFGRFESVEHDAIEEEPEEPKAKEKPKPPEKEKRKSFFSKKESEKSKDKIMYGRIPNTNLVNAGTQTGEKEPEKKKSLGEKVVDIQEKVHMVATGMSFTGSVLNKVGEEINDKFATKKDGKPKARTATAANSLEMIGSVLKKTGDFEDKVNTQFEKFKKPKDDEEKT